MRWSEANENWWNEEDLQCIIKQTQQVYICKIFVQCIQKQPGWPFQTLIALPFLRIVASFRSEIWQDALHSHKKNSQNQATHYNSVLQHYLFSISFDCPQLKQLLELQFPNVGQFLASCPSVLQGVHQLLGRVHLLLSIESDVLTECVLTGRHSWFSMLCPSFRVISAWVSYNIQQKNEV